jgi:hypothetical protein
MPAKCQLCSEPVEEPDQPEGAELCNSCAVYLNAKFGWLDDVLCDPALQEVIDADERKG